MENQPKQYLYHRVPEDMQAGEDGKQIIYPLNMLKEKFPGLYQVKAEKYHSSDYRRTIPEKLIPTLENTAWGDVVQLTAIHPNEIKKALVEAGFEPKELKFYQIDPELLDPEKTTIYLYNDDEDASKEEFVGYDPKNLAKHSVVTDKTKQHYKERFEQGKHPFLFIGVPHIFHKGPIDVSEFPVITTETEKDK